jgi:tetratricopeptide (TPR) repeat protein
LAIHERERAQATAHFIASTFQGVDPGLRGAERPLTALEILDQAQRRLDVELSDEPALKMHLHTVIARSYLGLFEAKRAHQLLSKALANARMAAAADRETVRTMNLLMAQTLLQLTQLDEADRHLHSVFATLDRGVADPAYVTAKVTQSAIDYKRSRYEDAARAAEDALSAADSMPSVEPALLADVHTAIGKAAGMLRDSARSLEHNKQAYELALQAFGDDHLHPKVLEMEHNYAASLIDVGRLEEAVPHLERSLASAEQTYGESSLIAAQYTVRLGLAHMERGELARAIELMERGNRLESTFDVGASPSMAGRLRTLARANLAARRTQEAATHIQAAIAVMQKFDAPFMLRVLEADQAFIRAANGADVAQAVEQLEQVIAAQDRGESRYKTHLPDFYLGTLHLWNSNPSAAVRHLERGVVLARAQTRKSDLGEALTQLGYAKLDVGDPAAAEQAFNEALEHLRSTELTATPARADALLGLARIALQSVQLDLALELLNEAQASWKRFAPNAAAGGEILFWLGEAHIARNEPQLAKESFDAASRALRGSPLPTHAALLQRLRTR